MRPLPSLPGCRKRKVHIAFVLVFYLFVVGCTIEPQHELPKDRIGDLLQQSVIIITGSTNQAAHISKTQIEWIVEDIKAPLSIGSGFLVTDDGDVLTAQHVVHEREGTICVFYRCAGDWCATAGRVLYGDESLDLAILGTNIEPTSYARFETNEIKEHQPIFTIGARTGIHPGHIVSIDDGAELGEIYIRQNVGVGDSQGDSGGMIANVEGQVIGVLQGGYARRWPYKGERMAYGALLTSHWLSESLARAHERQQEKAQCSVAGDGL
jgi:S1-C subfamily serine protease